MNEQPIYAVVTAQGAEESLLRELAGLCGMEPQELMRTVAGKYFNDGLRADYARAKKMRKAFDCETVKSSLPRRTYTPIDFSAADRPTPPPVPTAPQEIDWVGKLAALDKRG